MTTHDAAAGRSIDILVACADEDARGIVGAVLRHAGWRVREVDDPAAVLAAVRSARPALVVTSYPTETGEDCTITQALRRHPETAAIPILNVTGRAFPADLAEAEAAGVTASLVMPVAPAAVADAVERLLRADEARDGALSGPRRDV
jgi:CheY-like chemotaxis protein